ncbi:hypothetical protein ACU52_04125 [Xylanibacter rarus]|uniref:Uncharacterized protein n=1 Tax=Xylanibacter rarus TaxID=1676614 RepID=A0A8E1QYE4_9BACT|nr:hypothetical protein ACU52_04125 [Xylanibacter rarus]
MFHLISKLDTAFLSDYTYFCKRKNNRNIVADDSLLKADAQEMLRSSTDNEKINYKKITYYETD